MKFDAKKHLQELIYVGDYYAKKNDDLYHPRFPATKRAFFYRVLEAKDKSFVDAQCGIYMGGFWYIWPRACIAYAQAQAEKTLRQRGSRAA